MAKVDVKLLYQEIRKGVIVCPRCRDITSMESRDGKDVIVCRSCRTVYGTITQGESGHSIEV